MEVLWTLLAVLAWGAAAVLVLAVLVCVTPLRLELSLDRDARWHGAAALRPFGRMGPRLPLSIGDAGKQKSPDKQKPRKKAKRHGRQRRTLQIRPMPILRGALRLIEDVFGQIRVERAFCDVRFGFEDPATTGQAYGYLTPLIYGSDVASKVDFRFEPVFDRSVFEGHFALDISLVPARLIMPALRFAWTVLGRQDR